MAEVRGPQLFTIPGHHGFADSLVAGLQRRAGTDPMALARATVILPNNRAGRAVTDAFVRASGGALLLPRLVAIGDPELGEATGAAIDAADATDPPPPAVSPYARRLILARLVSDERARAGQPVGAAEAVRLAGELARVSDQLAVEEVPADRLRTLDLGADLAVHWERARESLSVLLDRWPHELAALGRIDAADRRRRLLDALAERWRVDPPAGLVCAAGVTDSAPAVARLLRRIAELPRGLVVFAGLDTAMDEREWDALGPHEADPVTGRRPRAIEVHPQFHLKLLLDRMGVGRDEVQTWREVAGAGSDAARGRAVANALAPAEFTGRWTTLGPAYRRLSGVRAAEFATAAEEAQGIALSLREALETPGRTAALVTPDRGLARRVAAHCRRWGSTSTISAGRPLSILPPGTLLLAIAEAATQGWAPARAAGAAQASAGGGGRPAGVARRRAAARPCAAWAPPARGLDGTDGRVADEAARWWAGARTMLEPIAATIAAGPQPLGPMIATLRETATTLAGDAAWTGPAGRAAAELLAEMEAQGAGGPPLVDPAELAPMLRVLADEVAVRPPQGGHRRVAI